jgi:hypothetical protein
MVSEYDIVTGKGDKTSGMSGRYSSLVRRPPVMRDPYAVALSVMRRRSELVGLAALVAFELTALWLGGNDTASMANYVAPVALAVILLFSATKMARKSAIVIWTPLFWFRIAAATYCGFGALVPKIANEATLDFIYALQYFDDDIQLRINVIYGVGILLTLTVAHLVLARRSSAPAVAPSAVPARSTVRFTLVFLMLGGCLRYGLALPVAFGLSPVVPGMFLTLANVYYVGIFLLIYQAVRGKFSYGAAALVLIIVDLLFSIATFAKTEMLLLLVFAFLGFISARATPLRVGVGAGIVLVAYFLAQPLVHYGRSELVYLNGSAARGSLADRTRIISDYLSGAREHGRGSGEEQMGMLRLSYVNADAFVVNRYDLGNPGNTLRNAFVVLVPRILWPGKPIISSIGTELTYLIFGFTTSSTGVTLFAEAYWNYGWQGVFVLMTVFSVIIAIFSRFSLFQIAHQNWVFLPVVFIGVNIGIRIDGYFVTDVIGKTWMAIVLGLSLILARSAFRLLASNRYRNPSTSNRKPRLSDLA